MISNNHRRLLAFAAQLPPSRARMVVEAIAAKDAPKEDDFDAALEAMAVVMEARIVKQLEEQFTE